MDAVQAQVIDRGSGTVPIGRRIRSLTVIATLLLVSLPVTGWGISGAAATGSPSPSAFAEDAIGGGACELPGVTVVTSDETIAPDSRSMAGIDLHLTGDPDPAESILFVVSLADGPMPPFRERLMAIEGMPHGRAAILLTRADDVDDPELTALVLLEVRELLASHGQPDADTLPAFLDNDPNLALLLRGLAVTP
jgi:hypothetical protein